MVNYFWDNIFKTNRQEKSLQNALKNNILFSELSGHELKLVKSIINVRNYRTGETIFHQGEIESRDRRWSGGIVGRAGWPQRGHTQMIALATRRSLAAAATGGERVEGISDVGGNPLSRAEPGIGGLCCELPLPVSTCKALYWLPDTVGDTRIVQIAEKGGTALKSHGTGLAIALIGRNVPLLDQLSD